MKKIYYSLKNRFNNFKITFKQNYRAAKQAPKSKRKSFLIGFGTVIGIFGITLFAPALSAVAKDLPRRPANLNPEPGGVVPTGPGTPPAIPPSNSITNAAISGMAASISGLAITSGSFVLGIACGCLVVLGILQLEKK